MPASSTSIGSLESLCRGRPGGDTGGLLGIAARVASVSIEVSFLATVELLLGIAPSPSFLSGGLKGGGYRYVTFDDSIFRKRRSLILTCKPGW